MNGPDDGTVTLWLNDLVVFRPTSQVNRLTDDELAGLTPWLAVHPEVDRQRLIRCTSDALYRQVAMFCQPQTTNRQAALLMIHRYAQLDSKTPQLQKRLAESHAISRALGMKCSGPEPTSAHLQLAGAMLAESDDCLMIFDGFREFGMAESESGAAMILCARFGRTAEQYEGQCFVPVALGDITRPEFSVWQQVMTLICQPQPVLPMQAMPDRGTFLRYDMREMNGDSLNA
ncbi:hypothetical protein [Vibrio spartinae]|uniref:Uncharacterized protein n=1 Tax=Vibrio spartinae TaxID=1918945 RepID=A0A1N6M5E1_9VIBR|nr:hypothetical protein [Vibrio spartinae]QMV14998.1 hypothetical protein Vspart_02276 [Vibrio spartinae]SIO94600.1 hypothetical protein VSP9026_02325 [Vibrio spartinae]